jgi:hypothetical protein
MAVAVLSAVIGAAGTVLSAWIQTRGMRPGRQRHPGGAGRGSRKAGGQRADGRR